MDEWKLSARKSLTKLTRVFPRKETLTAFEEFFPCWASTIWDNSDEISFEAKNFSLEDT